MKIVIFAGGKGTRLWPLSRKNSPKQFDKIFDGKSTLQLAYGRIAGSFGMENIYVQTIKDYKNTVNKELKELPRKNIFTEPCRKNVGPAVALAMHKLNQSGYTGSVAIAWADHLMERQGEFIQNLKIAEKLIDQNPKRLVFMAERPRFASNNLGWINVGQKAGEIGDVDYFEFKGWKYKPGQDECDEMFKSGDYFWNPGYFISSVDFLLDKYKKLAPQIIEKIRQGDYEKIEPVHFDKVIAEKIDHSEAVVLKTNMGWSDPGTLYALKEALQKNQYENVTQGKVFNLYSKDCLVYNLENKKLVATVGLEGIVVVNTKDAMIVVPKEKVKEVAELVGRLESEGYDEYL
ncbi:MAG: sugar phosphate nucleotidyltransferase [Candidatus Kuenenbacteria bacterium]